MVKNSHGFSQGRGGNQIITIDPAQVGCGSRRDRSFEGARKALIVSRVDNPNPIVFLGVVVGDGEGLISGAIVPNQEVKVGVGLGEDAVEASGKEGGAVVDGGYDVPHCLDRKTANLREFTAKLDSDWVVLIHTFLLFQPKCTIAGVR